MHKNQEKNQKVKETHFFDPTLSIQFVTTLYDRFIEACGRQYDQAKEGLYHTKDDLLERLNDFQDECRQTRHLAEEPIKEQKIPQITPDKVPSIKIFDTKKTPVQQDETSFFCHLNCSLFKM